MPPDTDTKARRETWEDWYPGTTDDGISIDELLDAIQAKHDGDTPVTAKTLRYWQTLGVLPQPVKRWHEGATRAFYPRWDAVQVIQELLELQRRGYTLEEIGPRLRAYAASQRYGGFPGMAQDVIALADRYTETTQNPIKRIEVRLTDMDDREWVYTYIVRTPPSSETKS